MGKYSYQNVKVNHIYMIERFFRNLNETRTFNCQVDLEKKYSLSIEKEHLDNIEFSKKSGIFIRNCLPYTITKLDNGNFIFLNREYKPLGIFGNLEWVNYNDFEFLSFEYPENLDGKIYFHADSNRPQDSRKDYIEYLIRLKYFLIDYKNNEVVLDEHYYEYTQNIKFNNNFI